MGDEAKKIEELDKILGEYTEKTIIDQKYLEMENRVLNICESPVFIQIPSNEALWTRTMVALVKISKNMFIQNNRVRFFRLLTKALATEGFVNTLQAALPTFLELWKDLQSVTDEDYKFFLALVHSNPESPIPAQQVLASGDILSTEERQIFIVALREWVAKQPKEFQAQYVDYASQEVVDQLKAPALILAENLPADVTEYTMMIVGRNGIGKSCLVNETLKLAPEERLLEGISKTSHVTTDISEKSREFKVTAPDQVPRTVKINVIDTPGLEYDAEKREAKYQSLIDRLTEGINPNNPKPVVNVVIYCFPASTARLEPTDIEYIKAFSAYAPVVAVMLQALTNFEEFKQALSEVKLPLSADLCAVMSRGNKTTVGFEIPSFGLPQLARTIATLAVKSKEIVDELVKTADKLSEEDLNKRVRRSKAVVISFMAAAAAAGANPIPFADIAVLASLQTAMMAAVTALFGASIDRSLLAAVASVILGTGGAAAASRGTLVVLNIFKLIPGINLVASGISATVAASVTGVMGMSFINVMYKLAKENRLGNIMMESILDMMKDEIKKQAEKSAEKLSEELRQQADTFAL
jgi:uncharacterized protein (DUF697 family)